MRGVTRNRADWQLMPDKKDKFLTEIAKAGLTKSRLSLTIWGGKTILNARLNGNAYFNHKEMQFIAEKIGLDYSDIAEMFAPVSDLAEKILQAAKISKPKAEPPPPPPKPSTVVTRTATGYQATFKGADGKTHFAYGSTELEARVAMDRRRKELEGKAEPAQEKPKEKPGDRLSVTISGDEAMVLLNQLMIDFRNKAVNEEDKPVIQSIFLRLSTQII